MHSSRGGSGEEERIPRVAPGWDPNSHSLSPAEGFLLSRIDGQTSWEDLRQIGGLSAADVDGILERWAKEGLILLAAGELAGPDETEDVQTAAPAEESRLAKGVDPSLGLEPGLQARILAFEGTLDRPYHELLGVERSAETRDIKRAYFRLSKEFHPDRYFRQNVGDFGARLDRIFKKIAEAYELLSDPTTRAEIERSLGSTPGPDAGAYQREGGPSETIGGPRRAKKAGAARVPTRIENLERLRRRFKVPKKVLIERQFKAKQFFRSAQAAAHEQRWLEAAASMRLAIAFDPWNAEYKAGFADIQVDVYRKRAQDLIERAADADRPAEALKHLEEALHYGPCDIQANARAGALCLELGELERAREYAETASELAPSEAAHHVLLARILRKQGLRGHATKALAAAAKLNANHPDVVAEQKQQRRPRQR